ncbi:MAG TPA: hypothetical protein G4N92_01830 [Anaerolineae bacterium]|nr:hypothetical protein [Anaerolineae bacterium]
MSNLLGAYGSLVSPPHYLVPYSIGENCSFIDLGFRVQKIAGRLWKIRVGSCFIGGLNRERKIKERLGLPQTSMIATFLVFGLTSEGLTGRIMND